MVKKVTFEPKVWTWVVPKKIEPPPEPKEAMAQKEEAKIEYDEKEKIIREKFERGDAITKQEADYANKAANRWNEPEKKELAIEKIREKAEEVYQKTPEAHTPIPYTDETNLVEEVRKREQEREARENKVITELPLEEDLDMEQTEEMLKGIRKPSRALKDRVISQWAGEKRSARAAWERTPEGKKWMQTRQQGITLKPIIPDKDKEPKFTGQMKEVWQAALKKAKEKEAEEKARGIEAGMVQVPAGIVQVPEAEAKVEAQAPAEAPKEEEREQAR